MFICGRYEGVDERVREGLELEEVSIGDYVLTGGELPALVMMDAAVRWVPGVLGDPESAKEDSFRGVVGLSPLYAAGDVPRLEYPGGVNVRKSRSHPGLASEAGPAQYDEEKAGPA